MSNNKKTKTDSLFELYLKQQKIKYEYEPYSFTRKKNFDYRFKKNNKIVLVEVKEIEETSFDRQISKMNNNNKFYNSFSLQEKNIYDQIRSKINKASKQLKHYQNKADYCVVIIGKKNNQFIKFDLDSNVIFNAMYGDPFLRIPFDLKTNNIGFKKIKKDYKINGALRKNRSTGIYLSHRYISAVGIIIEFNGYENYKREFIKKLCKQKKYIKLTNEEKFKFLKEKLRNIRIPTLYKDKDKKYYKILIISNFLGDKPLPMGIFIGRWDEIIFKEKRATRRE